MIIYILLMIYLADMMLGPEQDVLKYTIYGGEFKYHHVFKIQYT